MPMGDMVSEMLTRIGREMSISQMIGSLLVCPHASGANNGPISKFLRGTGEDEWSRRFVSIAAKVRSLSG